MTTREEVIEELHEVEQDLLMFSQIRDLLHGRLRALESKPERRGILEDWPVFAILDNAAVMAIVRCEGLQEDYRTLLETSETPNNVFKLEKRP